MKGWLVAACMLLPLLGWAETSILILHSYHEAYPWTKAQNDGFMAELDKSRTLYPFYSTEYLDTKRRQMDEGYERDLVRYLRGKYRGYRPDLVYVTEDNALHFILHHRRELFSSTPVVFSGINDLSRIDQLRSTPFRGVYEIKKALPNLRLIEKLYPGERETLLIGDGSTTSLAIHDAIDAELRGYRGMNVRYVDTPSIAEVESALHAYRGKTVILTTIGAFRDPEGKLVSLQEAIDRIVGSGDFLVFSLEETYIRQGVVGGYAVDGISQGTAAGQIARMLLPHPASPLPESRIDANRWIFDAQATDTANVTLPSGIAAQSRWLNEPATFYQTHESLIVTTIYGLFLGLSAIGALFTLFLYRSRRMVRAREKVLRILSDRLIKAQNIARIGNWEWDVRSGGLWWSDEIYRIFGIEQSGEVTYERFMAAVHPDDREKVQKAVDQALLSNTEYHIVHRIVRPLGEIRYVREEGQLETDDAGVPYKMVGTVHDITEQYLRETEIEKLSTIVEQIDDSVMMTDVGGTITYVNAAFCAHTGFSREEAIGKTPRISRSGHHDKAFYAGMWETILEGNVFRDTFINRKKEGALYYEYKTITPIRDESGHINGFVSSGKDVTEQVRENEETRRLASTDKLTGICNRHKFEELFLLERERARRFSLPLSLILIDIDHFKSVNDTYGHNTGDVVLIYLANIVRDNVRKIDVFARWGGEEFVILCPGTDLGRTALLAEKIRTAVEEATFLDVGHITVSMGISSCRGDETFETLFKRSDQALYRAKKNGRNRIESSEGEF